MIIERHEPENTKKLEWKKYLYGTRKAWNCLFCFRDGFNCAQVTGGFWYNACSSVVPNSVWSQTTAIRLPRIFWFRWKGREPLKETVIKMRCDLNCD